MHRKPANENPLFGAVFVGSGLILLAFVIFMSEERLGSPRALGLLIALTFVILGLWLMQAHRLLMRRYSWAARINWQHFGGGFITMLMGTIIVIGSYTSPDDSFYAPRWVVTAAGVMFVSVGLYVLKAMGINQGLEDKDEPFSLLLLAITMTGFGLVISAVAIGIAGESATTSLDMLGFVRLNLSGGDLIVRLLLIPVALLVDALAISAWVALAQSIIKSWRS